MKPSVLYLSMLRESPSHEAKLSGVRRFCEMRGWEAVPVPREGVSPEVLPELFRRYRPVVGCVADGIGSMALLPPRLFRSVPVCYIGYPPGTTGRRPNLRFDARAIAAAALREFESSLPSGTVTWEQLNQQLEALEEQNANARPELKAMPDISGYNTIYFGFPCWWGDLPMPVYTALEALDWNGKTISPFNTHAGSGESGMFSKVAGTCAGSTVTEGLTVEGTVAQNDRITAESDVDAWLASL